MRYVKTTKSLKESKIKNICFKDFKVEDKDEVLATNKLNIQNLVKKNGSLICESGVRELAMPHSQLESNVYDRKFVYPDGKSFTKLFQYKYFSEKNNRYDYSLIMLDNTHKVYHANMFMFHTNLLAHNLLQFSEEPQVFKFRVGGVQDVICFCTPTEGIVVWDCDAEPYVAKNAPKFKSICLHNSRLFVIDKNNDALIRFSSNKNPLDWSHDYENIEEGAGKIELNEFKGMLEKLVSFLDNLYVFTKFGISKISIYSSNNRYTISNIFSSSAKILSNTICVCGQNIYFLAQDGLYSFDGYDVKKQSAEICDLLSEFDQENAKTCYFDGKLYIACKLNFNDENVDDRCEVNNAIIVFNIENGSYSIIRNIDVKDMMAINELSMKKLVLCLNDASHKNRLWEICSPENSEFNFLKKYKIGPLTLGEFSKKKVLKSVSLICTEPCKMVVKTESQVKTFDIKASQKLTAIRINLSAKQFEIVFEGESSKFLLKPPQFTFLI